MARLKKGKQLLYLSLGAHFNPQRLVRSKGEELQYSNGFVVGPDQYKQPNLRVVLGCKGDKGDTVGWFT